MECLLNYVWSINKTMGNVNFEPSKRVIKAMGIHGIGHSNHAFSPQACTIPHRIYLFKNKK